MVRSVTTYFSLAITLALVLLGIGILSGLILPDVSALQGKMRTIMGLLLVVYGVFRSTTLMAGMRRKGEDEP